MGKLKTSSRGGGKADTLDLGSSAPSKGRESSNLSRGTMIRRFFEFIKLHKLATFLIGLTVLIILLTVPRRIISYVKGPAEKYETAKVKKESLQQTISASGEVQSETQATLRFQASAQLAWVGVKEGDYVKKGQAIASLDKRSLEMTLKKELNDYMNERWDFEQTREDYNITTNPLEQYTLVNEVRRILEKAQFDLNNSVIDVEIADLAKKLATIISPIEGIVTTIESPVAGVNITPATAEFIIADPSAMKFVADVDESDIAAVRIGQEVIISLDSYLEEEFEGQVSRIAFASITTSGGGTAFPVEIPLATNVDQRFKVGMNGDAEIIIESRPETLTVPLEAIKRKEGQEYVQVIEGRKIKEVEVKTGVSSDTKIEILEGLSEGQVVITGEKKKVK